MLSDLMKQDLNHASLELVFPSIIQAQTDESGQFLGLPEVL